MDLNILRNQDNFLGKLHLILGNTTQLSKMGKRGQGNSR